MAGQIYHQIQRLLIECGRNDPAKASFVKTKLILKGIDPDKWGPTSVDSPEVLKKINSISQTLLGA